jgi:hypothetical protein
LAGALAITPSLVGIDLAHAFEQFLRIGFIDFWGAWPFTTTAAAGRGDGSIFLSLIRHTAYPFARYKFAEKSRNSSRARMKILQRARDRILRFLSLPGVEEPGMGQPGRGGGLTEANEGNEAVPSQKPEAIVQSSMVKTDWLYHTTLINLD